MIDLVSQAIGKLIDEAEQRIPCTVECAWCLGEGSICVPSGDDEYGARVPCPNCMGRGNVIAEIEP